LPDSKGPYLFSPGLLFLAHWFPFSLLQYNTRVRAGRGFTLEELKVLLLHDLHSPSLMRSP
jgi:large subunit ribosomal protein L13e